MTQLDAQLAADRERFEVAADLPASATRTRRGWRSRSGRCCEDRGYAGFTFHFDSFGGDGRFQQLPLLAASNLMADGYGFAAEGDVNTAALMCAAHVRCRASAHFSELYAMDWELDSVLVSHMGEGNWRIARRDRPIRLIDRPLGIGRLDNPPTPVFARRAGAGDDGRTGPARRARDAAASSGTAPCSTRLSCRRCEMHHFHFRPDAGMERFMDRWLTLGGAASLRHHARRRSRRAGGHSPSSSSSSTWRSSVARRWMRSASRRLHANLALAGAWPGDA